MDEVRVIMTGNVLLHNHFCVLLELQFLLLDYECALYPQIILSLDDSTVCRSE